MIQIAIDGNEANVTNPVGSNVYAQKLIAALEKTTIPDHPDLGTFSVTVLTSQPALKTALPPARTNWQYQVVAPTKLWTQFGLPLYLFNHRKQFDVFFTPGHYAPRNCPIPYVSSVMDTAYLTFPNQFKKQDLLQLTNWTEYSVQHADRVIAISQATKSDVITHYGVPADHIVIAYPSLPTSSSDLKKLAWTKTKTKKRFGLDSLFIVYVGTFQPRKNLIRLVEAFEQLTRSIASSKLRPNGTSNSNLENLQLVLAGKTGWLADPILDRIKKSPFSKKIITPGYVTEEEKASLLKHADCSVLVGLQEGFGIPALESMAVGTLPVVSKTSSLPEVVGKGGIQVDPESVTSIANGLHTAISLTSRGKGTYRREMRQHLKQFSWDTSAQTVLDTLLAVVKDHRAE